MPGRLCIALLAAHAILPAPRVPKEIAVPPGHKLLFMMEARGVQVYKAVKGKSGKLAWVLEAPLADLFDARGKKAGYHYDGPSWEAADGSKVVRDKAEDVKVAPAPNPKADIPWLLVKVRREEGKAGRFSPGVYVQRLRTAGGHPRPSPPGGPGRKSAWRTGPSTTSTARQRDQPRRRGCGLAQGSHAALSRGTGVAVDPVPAHGRAGRRARRRGRSRCWFQNS
jgi:hypothetical protein